MIQVKVSVTTGRRGLFIAFIGLLYSYLHPSLMRLNKVLDKVRHLVIESNEDWEQIASYENDIKISKKKLKQLQKDDSSNERIDEHHLKIALLQKLQARIKVKIAENDLKAVIEGKSNIKQLKKLEQAKSELFNAGLAVEKSKQYLLDKDISNQK
jgi:hypothetical protein